MKHWQAAAVAAISALCVGAVSAETVLIHGEAGPNRGALFKPNAALRSIHDGVAVMGTINSVYDPKEFSSYGIADLPLDNPVAWVKAASKAGLDGSALLDEYRAFLAKYANERDTNGDLWIC